MMVELPVRIKAIKDEDEEEDEDVDVVDEEDVVGAVVMLPTPARSKETLMT